MSAFVVIDLECTSREPAGAHIVEWAAVVVRPPWFGEERNEEHGGLVKPAILIPPETSAVHHIIDADVAEAPVWLYECERLYNLLAEEGSIAVAHNTEYERAVLTGDFNHNMPDIPGLRWLCTYKASLRVWPDCPSHSNECLRYFLGFGTGRSGSQAPHSAIHDARVTAQLLAELLRVGTSIEDMLKWTTEPAKLPRCPIGVWRGKKWEEVDEGFLQWMLYKARDMRKDLKYCAKQELERRDAARRAEHDDEEEDEVPF